MMNSGNEGIASVSIFKREDFVQVVRNVQFCVYALSTLSNFSQFWSNFVQLWVSFFM